MRRDKVHCHKPLAEANLGILEDCTYGYGELVLKVLADIATILADVGMGRTTVRTYSLTIAPMLLGNGLLADFLRREVISYLNE